MTGSTYADRINGITTSVAIKAPVRVATTANITLSGLQTIDGVTVVADDRVLVKNQTTGSENGIYNVASTAWSRAKDFNGSGDVVQGTRVLINAGSTYTGMEAHITTANDITIGTTSLAFALTTIIDTAIAVDLDTVAGISADVTTVADDLTGANTIGTVAGISANVTTVAGVSANVTTVAGISANVTTVSGISADVQSVAAQVSGWAFDASTTMADPGAGEVRLNNATLSSVTSIAVDDANSDAVDVSAWVTTWDNTGNAGSHGTLVLRKAGNSAVFGIYTIASLTDNAGWTEVALTHVASNGTFSAADIVLVTVSPHGVDGVGDVVGPASATADAVALFDGTTGKVLKNGVAIGTTGAVIPKLSTVNTWGAPQRKGMATVTDGTLAIGTTQDFIYTPSGADTLDFTGELAGLGGIIYLNNTTNYAIALGAECLAPDGMATAISTTGRHTISYNVRVDGGGTDTVELSFSTVV